MFARSGLFKWIWRFNALGIAVGVAMGLFLGTFIIYNVCKESLYRPRVHNVVNVDKTKTLDESYKFALLETWPGSSFGALPLTLSQHIQGAYVSKYSNYNVVNYLFVDLEDGQSHWLLPHHSFLILRMMTFPEPTTLPAQGEYPNDTPEKTINTQKPRTFLYEIVKGDTNADQRLSKNDLKTIALSKGDGQNYKEIISDVITLHDAKLSPQGDLVIIFEDATGHYTSIVSLDTFTVKQKNKVSLTP